MQLPKCVISFIFIPNDSKFVINYDFVNFLFFFLFLLSSNGLLSAIDHGRDIIFGSVPVCTAVCACICVCVGVRMYGAYANMYSITNNRHIIV